ncbi:MAG: hypothetical protein EAZ37_17115 [Burkholderiales bacterium]|nr:MAG: hypothetical protein EAZ43_14895 [Betaproteobacteria bacterium]TAG24107.1 MAG: hypothetical protein EAZ37_17115 [Burkholderiales bacterium]
MQSEFLLHLSEHQRIGLEQGDPHERAVGLFGVEEIADRFDVQVALVNTIDVSGAIDEHGDLYVAPKLALAKEEVGIMRRAIIAILTWGVMWSAWAQVSAQAAPAVGAIERDREALLATLRAGGAALLLRHAQTVAGVGDPPNFKLGDCKTQRNLSREGGLQAKRMGEALRASKVSFAQALSSQWCRCADTAKHIVPAYVTWPPLNSFFNDFSLRDSQTRTVKDRLLGIPKHETWLLVTHQVNITAMTGVSPPMGEGVVIRVGDSGMEVIGLLAM